MEQKKRVKFAHTIWEITESLRGAKKLEEALAFALRCVVKAADAQAGTIWFLNKEDDRLYPIFNIGPVDISGISVANGQGIAGGVVKKGTPVVVADCSKEEHFHQKVDKKTGFLTQSLICVPLINKYEVIGCIQILNKNDGSLYTMDELELCENLASLIAIAVDEKGFLVKVDANRKVLMRFTNITKEFHTGGKSIAILKGISLDVYEKELVVILGESGCGKSTFLNIVGGMDTPTGGEVQIEGQDFTHASEKELTLFRRCKVGFVFQSYHLMPNLTAVENLNFIGELCDNPMNAEEALRQVNLEDKKDNYPSQMSGGQQQRVSIARAIMKRPKLILADEPTAALDSQTGLDVLQVFENILREQGTTIVMVTHNIEIAKMANRIVRMKDGRIADIQINMHPLKAAEMAW